MNENISFIFVRPQISAQVSAIRHEFVTSFDSYSKKSLCIHVLCKSTIALYILVLRGSEKAFPPSLQKNNTPFYYFYNEEKIRKHTLLIDIHTHQPNFGGRFSIYNVQNSLEIPAGINYVSLGLHPWYIESDSLHQKFHVLEQLASDPRVLFIGECGLDKVCITDFELQIRALKLQIDLADQLKKPIMIHCVRAHNEVIQLLTESKIKMPVVFHGFNKNKQIADMILRHGHYLSFGSDLNKDHVSSTFAALPLDRIFLESDDKEADIGMLYKLAAELLNISQEQLESQIASNLRTILGPEFKGV